MAQERPVRVGRRLAAILAADVVGYSRLMHRDEEDTHARLTSLLTEAVHPAIAEHRGRIVKNTGDGFLAEFPSAVEAVRGAVQFQTRIKEITIDELGDTRIALRVGINIGDVIVEPHDIFGDGVNIAARLEGIAEPGGICIASSAYDQIRGKVGVQFADLGEQNLKNIACPIRSYAVVWETPSQATRASTASTSPTILGHGSEPVSHVRQRKYPFGPFRIVRSHEETGLIGHSAVKETAARRAMHLLANIKSGPNTVLGMMFLLAAVGALAVGLIGYWTTWKPARTELVHASTAPRTPTGSVIKPTHSQGPIVLILPLINNTGDPRYDAVASILTEHIGASIGKFSSLRVIERSLAEPMTTTEYGQLARKTSAQYVIGGSLRGSAKGMAISIQLSDALAASSVWSRNFEVGSEIISSTSLQDELAGQAATLIAAYPGAIATAEYKRVQAKPTGELSSYECIIQGVLAGTVGTPAAVIRARECLDRVTREESANATAWAVLAGVMLNQRSFGFGLPQDEARSIDKRLYLNEAILKASLRAAELAPDDSFVRFRLAIGYFANCQTDLLQYEAERAIALNPYDAYAIGSLGLSLAFSGHWDAGAAMAEKALGLMGASAPSLWWYAPAKRHWSRGEHQEAYETFRRGYVEGLWLSHLNMAYALASLDRLDEAKAHVTKLLKLEPEFSIREANSFFRTYCLEPSFREKMASALRKAGLPEE
ncbi:adenylate/guanylate cyclase domain-containing protein [Bradyrhizobium sp. 956_D2_N1_5]|uniref:adenylate/guanylate cyclase domain-containing protein n=1 Tax=unclassified Bradyrhizobium TaxID=2631580 RepID=UPI003F26030B